MRYIFSLLLIAGSLCGMEADNPWGREIIHPRGLLCEKIVTGDVDEVAALIDKGHLPTDTRFYPHNEPMLFAFMIQDPEKRSKMIHLLLHKGIKPDSLIGSPYSLRPYQSLLESAVEDSRVDDIALLLAYGADPNRCNRDGETALHKAAESYREAHWYKGGVGEQEAKEVMELLLMQGAKPQNKSYFKTTAIDLVGGDEVAELMLTNFSEYCKKYADSMREQKILLESMQLLKEIDEKKKRYGLLGVVTGNLGMGFAAPPVMPIARPEVDSYQTPKDAGKRKRLEMPPTPHKARRGPLFQ